MAGIGFELRRMIDQREGLLSRVRAYVCAGLISAGPWMMTILTLSILSMFGRSLGGDAGYETFRSLVTFCYAFSLILVGIGQMAITRQVADHLYGRRYDKALSAFVATLIVVAVVSMLIGTAFCTLAGFEAATFILAVVLFVTVSMTWVALIWLSIVREFDEVLRAYAYGVLVCVCVLAAAGSHEGPTVLLAGYAAGHSLTLWLLIRTILQAMEQGGLRDFSVFKSLKRWPDLVLVGLFYNAAIWVDKIVFWFIDGTGSHALLRFHPMYDTCCYLAYLTVVPSLTLNLIWIETSFYEHYRAYFGSILGGHPLRLIEDRRDRMLKNLRDSVVRLLRVQGFITVLCILFAPVLIRVLEMETAAVGIFRRACLGALFHVFLLITVLVQLYFDFRKEALITSFVFLVLNGALAFVSVVEGVETYGVGYALASFLSLGLAFFLLHRGLDQLDFRVFTNQAIAGVGKKGMGEVQGSAKKERKDQAARPAFTPPVGPSLHPSAVDSAAGEWSWPVAEEMALACSDRPTAIARTNESVAEVDPGSSPPLPVHVVMEPLLVKPPARKLEEGGRTSEPPSGPVENPFLPAIRYDFAKRLTSEHQRSGIPSRTSSVRTAAARKRRPRPQLPSPKDS